MLSLREPMSTTLSRANALLRLTMSATTPGCGMFAMSGALLAWMLVMISWLMLLTLRNLTVMPFFFASGTKTFIQPSMVGWSLLPQMVMVELLLLPPPLPHAARADAATSALAASSEVVRARLVNRII